MSPSIRGALHAIDTALVAVRAALTSTEAAAQERHDDNGWITQENAPCGRRVFMRACRAGLIKDARKLSRKWIASRIEVERFIQERGKSASPSIENVIEREGDHDPDQPTAEDIARELATVGLAYAPRARKLSR